VSDTGAIHIPTLTSEFPAVGDDPHIDAPLRATVRRLSTLLGRTLADQHGQELLDLVEDVRRQTKEAKSSALPEDAQAVQERLASLPTEQAIELTRAFTKYFLLANSAEQAYRVRSIEENATEESWVPRTVRDVAEARGPEGLQEAVDSLDIELVFTAHPTEASRRAVLTKLRRLSDLLAEDTEPDTPERRTQDARMSEVIEVLWQTDELRSERPTPQDEARNALYYLRDLYRNTMPGFIESLRGELRHHGADLAPGAVRCVFGTWMGGDRDGNPYVTAPVTAEVISLQADAAIDVAIEVVTDLIGELSISSELVGDDEQLRASLAEDFDHADSVPEDQQELFEQEPLPAQARGDPGQARGDPDPSARGHRARARTRLPQLRRAAGGSGPGARGAGASPRRQGGRRLRRDRPETCSPASGSAWPRWTCASTPRSITTCSHGSSTAWASWIVPMRT
jgi:phosphoenolpyruvate carboxylase